MSPIEHRFRSFRYIPPHGPIRMDVLFPYVIVVSDVEPVPGAQREGRRRPRREPRTGTGAA